LIFYDKADSSSEANDNSTIEVTNGDRKKSAGGAPPIVTKEPPSPEESSEEEEVTDSRSRSQSIQIHKAKFGSKGALHSPVGSAHSFDLQVSSTFHQLFSSLHILFSNLRSIRYFFYIENLLQVALKFFIMFLF